MTALSSVDQQLFARELFSFVQAIDPSRFRAELRESVVSRAQALAERAREATARLDSSQKPLGDRLGQVAQVLAEAPAVGPAAPAGEWEVFRKKLLLAYDDLALQLRREAIHAPTVRATNYTRSLFHVGSAVGAMLLVQHVLTPRSMIYVTGAAAASAWSMEISRRVSPAANRVMMKVFKNVAHEHERHNVNSSTWYTTALLLLALTMSPLACSVGLMVLGLGDPAAGLIGRRFGRTRLASGRSVEGSLAFIVAGALGAAAMLAIYYPSLSIPVTLAVALAAATPAAIVELLVSKIDDNFSIPVVAGAGASLAAWLLAIH